MPLLHLCRQENRIRTTENRQRLGSSSPSTLTNIDAPLLMVAIRLVRAQSLSHWHESESQRTPPPNRTRAAAARAPTLVSEENRIKKTENRQRPGFHRVLKELSAHQPAARFFFKRPKGEESSFPPTLEKQTPKNTNAKSP
jgi:hypothetical protein